MNWLPIKRKDGTTDPLCIQSSCGKYTVAKVTCDGRSLYELWRQVDNAWALHEIHNTAELAKRAAEVMAVEGKVYGM